MPLLPADNDSSAIANNVRVVLRAESWASAFIKPQTETAIILPPIITLPDYSMEKSRAVKDDDDKYAKKTEHQVAAWTPTNLGPKKVLVSWLTKVALYLVTLIIGMMTVYYWFRKI